MDNPDLPNKSVIYELMQVIRQASDSIAVEQQIDEGFEVADSVRFEQSAIDWQSRIPDQTIPVKIRTINRWLDLIEGNVIHHSSDAMILKNTFHTYLVLTESVTAVQNLLTKIRTFDPAVVDDFLLTIWLHGIVDQQILATWFFSIGETLEGYCIRVGKNAVDVRCNSGTFTLPFGQLVAVRISNG